MKEQVDFHLLKAQYLQRMEVYHGLERTVALSQHAMTKSGSEAEMNTANGEWAVRLEDHATTNRQLGPLRRLLVCPELCRRYLILHLRLLVDASRPRELGCSPSETSWWINSSKIEI